ARRRLQQALDSGAAAERFARMVAALGGPRDILERAEHYLPKAPVAVPAAAPRRGFVRRIDVRALGLVVVALGGGRTQPGQAIDLGVGLSEVAGIGAEVGPDRPLAVVHARDAASAAQA